MDTNEVRSWSDHYPPETKPSLKYPTGARLLVGMLVSFVVMSLLYGPNLVIQAVVLMTICTLGLGGLVILFACWLVGWVVLAVWSEIAQKRASPSTP